MQAPIRVHAFGETPDGMLDFVLHCENDAIPSMMHWLLYEKTTRCSRKPESHYEMFILLEVVGSSANTSHPSYEKLYQRLRRHINPQFNDEWSFRLYDAQKDKALRFRIEVNWERFY